MESGITYNIITVDPTGHKYCNIFTGVLVDFHMIHYTQIIWEEVAFIWKVTGKAVAIFMAGTVVCTILCLAMHGWHAMMEKSPTSPHTFTDRIHANIVHNFTAQWL